MHRWIGFWYPVLACAGFWLSFWLLVERMKAVLW